MIEGPSNAARLDLLPGPRMAARAGSAAEAAPVIVTGPNRCRAPFDGPAVFMLPVVLPKTAVAFGGHVAVAASGAAAVRLNGEDLAALPARESRRVELPAECFARGRDFDIPGLSFSDFVRHELEVEVRAAAGEAAELTLEGRVDYRLPAESAAAYLTYVMTQA